MEGFPERHYLILLLTYCIILESIHAYNGTESRVEAFRK